jgi:hypothetical protein
VPDHDLQEPWAPANQKLQIPPTSGSMFREKAVALHRRRKGLTKNGWTENGGEV